METGTETKKPRMGRWALFGLLGVAALYVGVQLFGMLSHTYTTQTAVRATMDDVVACRGIVGRSETEIPFDGPGVLGYVAEDGARVAQGSVVAQVFADAAAADQSAYAKSLAAQIAALQKSEASTTGTDVEMLLRQTYAGVYDILDLLDSGDYRALEEKKSTVQVAQNKLQGVTGGANDYSEQIAALTDAYNAAVAQGAASEILAPCSGYFVAGEDSAQRYYTAQQLEEMTPQALRDAAQQASPPSGSGIAGKVIEDYRWRFFASMTLKEAAHFAEGGSVTLQFPDVSNEKLPATVDAIVEDEVSGLASVRLSCDYINEDVVTLEHANAVISSASYTGIRIDKRALRIVDGVKGVYIRYGNIVYFRRIQILFETNDFLLVPEAYTKGVNEVELYDEIILEGTDLSNGKVL